MDLRTIFRLALFTMPFALSHLHALQHDPKLYPIIRDDKLGYIDSLGREIIPPQYSVDEVLLVYDEKKYYDWLMDHPLSHMPVSPGRRDYNRLRRESSYPTGSEVWLIRQVQDEAWFSNGRAYIHKDINYGVYRSVTHGLLDEDGRLLEIDYPIEGIFTDSMAVAKIPQKLLFHTYGYTYSHMDGEGELRSGGTYQWTGAFSSGLAPVLSEDKYGFIDRNGMVAVDAAYDYVGAFHCGLAPFKSASRYGYLDMSGNTVMPAGFSYAGDFSEDSIALVRSGNKLRFIRPDGRDAFLSDFLFANDFHNGMALVSDSAGTYYIDTEGRKVLNLSGIEEIGTFSGGLARFRQNGRWGYMDRSGNVVIRPQFLYAGDFRGALAQVWKGKVFSYINRNGSIVWNPED